MLQALLRQKEHYKEQQGSRSGSIIQAGLELKILLP
jgi:hypothetical protein